MCRHFLYGVNWLHFENFIPLSSARLNHKIPNLHTGQTKSIKKSDAFGLFLLPNLLWTLTSFVFAVLLIPSLNVLCDYFFFVNLAAVPTV